VAGLTNSSEAEIKFGVKRLAVLVCAPGGMADEVRREFVAIAGDGGTRIDHHKESSVWYLE